MKIVRILFFMLIIFIVAVCGSAYYAFKIEPYRITYEEFTLNEKEASSMYVKVIQISDIHIKEDFTYKNLEKVVRKVNAQNPDIVVFTGDLYDNYAKYNDDENIIQQLSNIKAKYAKIAIWGNRDIGGGAVRQYETITEQSGFMLLKNEDQVITLDSGEKILFTGLDDALLGSPSMSDIPQIYDYNILLTHEPDTIENYWNASYDIALSGHSHGGQMNIPFLPFITEKAVSTSSLSTNYQGGMYSFEDKAIKQLYVNTGIGTTHISARFNVVPEVTVFHLYLS